MKKCPLCKSNLCLVNFLQVCEMCGWYRLVGKRKARIKVQNWYEYILDKKKP